MEHLPFSVHPGQPFKLVFGRCNGWNRINDHLRYDAEKSQETANTGFYGGTKSADEILNALKASMEAAFSSGSHITITTNADKTEG